jgi:hypothetical protein
MLAPRAEAWLHTPSPQTGHVHMHLPRRITLLGLPDRCSLRGRSWTALLEIIMPVHGNGHLDCCPWSGRHFGHSKRPELFASRRAVISQNTRISAPPLLAHRTTQFTSYLTDNTLCLHYKDQPSNSVQGNNQHLLWETCETHRLQALAENYRCFIVEPDFLKKVYATVRPPSKNNYPPPPAIMITVF